MRGMSTSRKLWGLLGIIWVAMLMLAGWPAGRLAGWGAWESRQVMLEERKGALRDYVDMTLNTIDAQARRVAAGEVSEQEARDAAAATVRHMIYDEGRGYFFVFNDDFELLAHPRLPEGTFVGDFQIASLSSLMAEISAASAEQSSGIEQVNQAVSQMDQMTQQNASLVQRSSLGTQRLHEQSHRLRGHVSRFRVQEVSVQASATTLPAPDPQESSPARRLQHEETLA